MNGDYLPEQKSTIQRIGLDTINTSVKFTAIMFLSVLGLRCAVFLGSLLCAKYKNLKRVERPRNQSDIIKEEEPALDTIGNDSVYQFFLTKSWRGWFIALASISFQYWIFFFVKAAERDLQDDASNLKYTYLCLRDQDTCEGRADLTQAG